MKFAPDYITALAPGEVMVFGANRSGRHGAGAAQYARMYLGAKYGVGEGLTGQCYALPTKGHNMEVLSLAEIRRHVTAFLKCAAEHPELTFLVTKIGTGLAGYSMEAIAPLFLEQPIPGNVRLPRAFVEAVVKP